MRGEPVKYVKNSKGTWVITPEWKYWTRQQKAGSKPKPKPKPKEVLTAENHQPIWKEVAFSPDSGKRIYFCACMKAKGDFHSTCGAAAIQESRTSKIIEALKPRFE